MKIALQGVTKRYGGIAAAEDVSLEIENKEIFFLLGPSGCGKTTLLRCIAGFCRPDKGRIFFDGRDVSDLPAHKRRAALVFQNYALWPHMTVAENVAFGLKVGGRKIGASERRQRVDAMLKAVRMSDCADRSPNQLSGGQQQRIALARALAVEPACLLLDEPLSNLDAKLRQEMRLEIKRLIKNAGMTAVYVTHDRKEALSMADRCAVLRAGRIEQIGAPEEIYLRPANGFVADFISGANMLPGRVAACLPDRAVKIVSAFGEWLCRPSVHAFKPGDAALVCVRPESVRILPADASAFGAGAPNTFAAEIAEAVSQGETTEYWLRAPDGSRLKALRLGPRPPTPATGSSATFHVEPDDASALPA